MKKYIITTSVAVLAFAAIAGAQSYSFNNDLTIGSTGPDVVQMQTWLINNGFNIPSIASGATAKGYFGSQTQAAVAAYQRSVGLPAFGYFGPLTRQYFNRGGGNIYSSGLRVLSPNGGEQWQRGTIQYITWTGDPISLSQSATIRLEFPTPACAQPGQPIRCMILARAPITLATVVDLSSRSYRWLVGSQSGPIGSPINCDPLPMGYTGGSCVQPPQAIPDGQYKVQICPTNGSACVDGASTFTISTNGSNGTNNPVINGIDAPTTLSVGQIGTWNVRATDPYNGTLSYSILWGDEPGYATTGGTMTVPAVMQTSSFTHSYANAGVYTVTVTVRNSVGATVQTSSTVTVTGSNNGAGPLKIITPNGYEIWQKGTTQTITWTSPYYIRATTAYLQVTQKYNCTNGQVCPAIAYAPYVIATNIPINQNTYSWNVGTYNYALPCPNCGVNGAGYTNQSGTLPDGQYTIQICETSSSNCDASDNTFTITSGQTSNLPDINIVSPNGGETWYTGSSQTINVNVTGNPSQIGNQITAYLVGVNNQQTYVGSKNQGFGAGATSFTASVPSTLAPGQYKLLVNLYSNTFGSQQQQQAYDYSDGYFTVTNAYQYPYTNNYYYPYGNPANCPVGYTCTPN